MLSDRPGGAYVGSVVYPVQSQPEEPQTLKRPIVVAIGIWRRCNHEIHDAWRQKTEVPGVCAMYLRLRPPSESVLAKQDLQIFTQFLPPAHERFAIDRQAGDF